jgi:putative ABC transport system permease protein
MSNTVWKKIFNDLWFNKTRTVLVVLSIAVGVAAIGTIAGGHVVFSRDLQESFNSINPANITIFSDPFEEDMVAAIRKIRGVRSADGRRTVAVRLQSPTGVWKQMNLTVIADYNDIRVNKLKLMEGDWPPPEKGVLFERSSLSTFPVKVGDTLNVEAPDGKKRSLKVAGLVHDISQIPSFFSGTLNGYITFNTLEALGEVRELDTMVVQTTNAANDKEGLALLARQVWDKIEKGGRKVYWTTVLPPGEHPLHTAFSAMLFLLTTMGVLALLLSGFLLVNTVTSILSQQMRQIGVMKTIGGTTRQIFSLYIGSVLCYSLLALVVAIPLGALGARLSTYSQADLANIEVKGFQIVPEVVLLQAVVAILISLAAAFVPLWRGTQIPVREALSSYGMGNAPAGRFSRMIDTRVDRLIQRFDSLSRPLRLSLRNTFRRKGRLGLTLATLTMAGAIFIAVFSVSQSIQVTTEELFEYFNYDIGLVFNKVHRVDRIEQEALSVPGVVDVECWGYSIGRILRNPQDENDSEQLFIYGPNADTRMIRPQMVSGRWLMAEDENALVINTDVVKKMPALAPGGKVTLKLAGKKAEWTVVGVAKSVMAGPTGYVNYPYFGRSVRETGRAGSVQVKTVRHDGEFQIKTARELEQHMKKIGLRVNFLQTTQELKEMILAQFNVLVTFLLIMAGLLGIVGALGLAGTMSINVVERTREIGVMRAVGAGDRDILQLVMVEGVMIGCLSWVMGLVLALPVSKFMSDQVGILFIQSPLTFRFSAVGALIWLVVILVVSALATWWPARNASRVSVRESLSYE